MENADNIRITGEKPWLTKIEVNGQVIPNVRRYVLRQEAGGIPTITMEIIVMQSDIDVVGDSVFKLEAVTEHVERQWYEKLKTKYGGEDNGRGGNIQADHAGEVDV